LIEPAIEPPERVRNIFGAAPAGAIAAGARTQVDLGYALDLPGKAVEMLVDGGEAMAYIVLGAVGVVSVWFAFLLHAFFRSLKVMTAGLLGTPGNLRAGMEDDSGRARRSRADICLLW
jgi:hypothetical protein